MTQHITQAQAEALAHRRATKYVHRSAPGYASYAFVPHTLMDFVRDIEAAAIQHYIDNQHRPTAHYNTKDASFDAAKSGLGIYKLADPVIRAGWAAEALGQDAVHQHAQPIDSLAGVVVLPEPDYEQSETYLRAAKPEPKEGV